jgi:hypothetical protein
MNTYKWMLTAMVAAMLTLVGCSKQGGVDTAPLEKGFKSADPAVQTSADKVVSAVKAADYSGAMAELKTLASNAKLTPEQQQAVKDVVAQVEKAIADAAAKATGEATKAMDDAKKALPK